MPDFPLAAWRVRGFRAIRQPTTLDLSGLNLILGANSAGKSSLMQSLLLAAQTLANPLVDRPLVLNGSFVQLGLADDCVNEASSSFSFGFDIAVEARSGSRPLSSSTDVAFDGTFGMTRGRSEFRLEFADLVVTDPTVGATGTDFQELKMRYVRETREMTEKHLRSYGLKGARVDDALRLGMFGVEMEPGLESPAAAEQVAGVRLRQFLPWQAYSVVDANLNALSLFTDRPWLHAFVDRRSARSSGRFFPDLAISHEVAVFIRDYLRSRQLQTFEVPSGRAPIRLSWYTQRLPEDSVQALMEMGDTEWYAEHLPGLRPSHQVARVPLPDPFESAVDAVRRFFAASVRHLGPLREGPRPLYGLAEAASGESVGRSGEYTAAVLSAHGQRIVPTPLPDGSGVVRIPLADAVDVWLSALTLVESIESEERGKLGFELRLHVEGVGRQLDLTTVGVGVSQALPIVVLGLISPPGSVIVLEQPELHLHPDVQAHLGDFFLALAASGRQLLVETHSEYLVNRLRRRAAERATANVPDLVRLFYVERSGAESAVRTIRINDRGGIPGWPAGFLDQAARETEAIFRAANDAQRIE